MTRKRSNLQVWCLDYLALLEEKENPDPESRSSRWKEWHAEYIRFMEEMIPPAEYKRFHALLIDVLNDRQWCKQNRIDYQDPSIPLAALKLCKQLWIQEKAHQEEVRHKVTLSDMPTVDRKCKDSKTIFVVDDEESIGHLMLEILTGLGYHVITCESGDRALAKVQEQMPDMVFLDLCMPGENGIKVLQKLLHIAPNLPVVILTGVPSLETAKKAMTLGARDYISKPFTMALIQETIADVLEIEGMQAVL